MLIGRNLSLLLITTAVCACGGGGGAPAADAPDDGFDRHALLQHLSTNVLLPHAEAFASTVAALPAAIGAYCDALDAGTPATTLADARTAWGASIDAWQRIEANLIGPPSMDQNTLRDRIYGWPLLSTCGIDRDTAASWASPATYDVAARLTNVRSLAAIEFLLFTTDTAHSCAITPTGWDALGADLPRARCRQALAIATDVAAQGQVVATAWRATGGNYVGELAEAGTSASSIPSAQEGVNRVSDGLYYVDKMVKDMKLAESAGIADNACGTVGTPCDREIELRYADRATQAIRINLASLREVFTGTTATSDGPGFDDFLRATGNAEIADRMTASLDNAIAKAAALPDSFVTALATDYQKVVDAHVAIVAFTDDLKSQFLTVLALEIPDDVAADND